MSMEIKLLINWNNGVSALTKTFGKVTVHFEPLIACGVLFGAILAWKTIHSVILELKSRKLAKHLSDGNYSLVICNGEKLLRAYQKYNARLSFKTLVARIEYFNFALAVAYFAVSDDNQFLNHITAMIKYSDIKEFWLCLFYLQKNEFDIAKKHYDNMAYSTDTYVNRTFLDAYYAYKKQEGETAKEKMTEVMNQLKHPILKKIAEEIVQ